MTGTAAADLQRVVLFHDQRIAQDPERACREFGALGAALRAEFAERRRALMADDLAARPDTPMRHAYTAQEFGVTTGILNHILARPPYQPHPYLDTWVTLDLTAVQGYSGPPADYAHALGRAAVDAPALVRARRVEIARLVNRMHDRPTDAARALGITLTRFKDLL